MVESEEIPLSPDTTSAINPINLFSGKKIYSLTPAYGIDFHRSEIPHNDLDYFGRDAVSRRLFHRRRCESCDCDCASDGFSGCLRRNRRCLYTGFVFLVSAGVVLLLFGSLSYKLTRQHVVRPSEHHFSFHHHFYNATSEKKSEANPVSLEKSNYRIPIPVIEDVRDPEKSPARFERSAFVDVLEKSQRFRWRSKREAESESRPIREALGQRISKLELLADELNRLEEELKDRKRGIEKEPKRGFRPFLSSEEETTVADQILDKDLSEMEEKFEDSSEISFVDDSHEMQGMSLGEAKKEKNFEISSASSEAPIPAFGDVIPYRMCIYEVAPSEKAASSVRSSSPRTFTFPFPSPPSSHRNPPNDPERRFFYKFSNRQNFYNFYVNNYYNGLSPSSTPEFPPRQRLPLFCTYLRSPAGFADSTRLRSPMYTFPSATGVAEFAPLETRFFSPSLPSNNQHSFSEKSAGCYEGTVPCRDGSSCILAQEWCDNKVQCGDASDEIYCSCRERIEKNRLCDGYFDCPFGEDETGCFDCPESEFSCDTWDSLRTCIPLKKRCDFVKDCPNGKDELDCTGLFKHVEKNATYHVSHARGFLHRNLKGEWFPVCLEMANNYGWAREACQSELGTFTGEMEMKLVEIGGEYKGPFFVHYENGSFVRTEHCKGHVATYVKCPSVPCGTRLSSDTLELFSRSKRDGKNVRRKRKETGRIVGGNESLPKAWPWAIALYKDGNFHCGGVILDEKWIMTAAHCVNQYWKHYYEVRAGMLRRFSYSPMEQVRSVADVVVHEKYDPNLMINDVALLRLENGLDFNRWVRPACLPKTADGSDRFSKEPKPGTNCMAVGWGAIREHGANPDQLREVKVPILAKCKHKDDVTGDEICAGVAEGGKDTCQGDSGGPLLCRNSKNDVSWYIAGIVSHGEGCARPNEPGAYTRVSLYMDWISANSDEFLLPSLKPLTVCPGLRCSSGSKKCVPRKNVCNTFVDCVDAEDERNCRLRDKSSDSPDDDLWPMTNSSYEKDSEGRRRKAIGQSDEDSVSTTASSFESDPSFAVTDDPATEDDRTFPYAPPTSEPSKVADEIVSSMHFQCKEIIQTIPVYYRCDGFRDCEDGTDERDCSCKDILYNVKSSAVCDGFFDCKDLSDEENCSTAEECSRKGEKCSRIIDCKSNNRVENCFALAVDGKTESETDGTFSLQTEGFLMENKAGIWSPVCLSTKFHLNSLPVVDVCKQLGTNGYDSYVNKTIVRDDLNCTGLYVRCSKRLTNNLKFFERKEKEYFWPWNAFVYSDGIQICSAVLLFTDWLLTSSACFKNVTLQKNYVISKLGSKKPEWPLEEYETQLIRIDDVKWVSDSDAILLHLNSAAEMTWNVRPLNAPYISETSDDKDVCVAVGEETVFLKPEKNCPSDSRCFTNSNAGQECKPWTGVVVCQSPLSWYPAATFHEKTSLCGFEPFTRPSLREKFHDILAITAEPTKEVEPPSCDGFRCRNGLCVTSDKICDGRSDCSTREDEDETECDKIARNSRCKWSEMRCGNGDCISKTLFGNGKKDCEDGSDEPSNATCLEYLKLTSPAKICDGRRNCYDKSDEDPNLCPCSQSTYKCSRSKSCISSDFVCDGEEDCPDGEDERVCVGFNATNARTKEVEIVHMSYGVWHSLCDADVTKRQADEICHNLGYKYSMNTRIKKDFPVVVKPDPFTSVKLNGNATVKIRGDKPFVNLILGLEICHTLVIKCT